MDKTKVKIPVSEGLPIIQAMVKNLTLCKEMGETISWIDKRQNKRCIRNFQFTFTEADLNKLNADIWTVGQRISVINIAYNTDRQVIIDQIRRDLSDIWLPYIYKDKMNRQAWWWKQRMINTSAKGTKCNFSEADIQKINLAVAETAARLLSIELIP